MLRCHQIKKCFEHSGARHAILTGVSLSVEPGQKCVLLGPSGSGKTTLLSILGCMLSPCSGGVEIAGQTVDYADKRRLGMIRQQHIGFVFQHAHLLPFLSVEANLRVVARNSGMARSNVRRRIDCVMARLGISHLKGVRPSQASGGERQRIAIARAILHRPAIVLADEPTAALDWENGQRAVQLLAEIAEEDGCVLLTVTHDTRLIPLFDRCLKVEEGKALAV